jgi:NTE family protein
VVIAVNVGSPLLKPEQVGSLLSVSAQMVNILTEQNVAQSLATLKPTDIYIKPDLETISAGDFDKHELAADRGRAAAQAVAVRLQALSVGEQQYAQWWGRFAAPAKKQAPRIDEIEIAALPHVNPVAVERHIGQKEGAPLDTEQLDEDLLRVFGDGWYEGVDYTLLSVRERNILRITPVEKGWGPNYLRLGVNLELADQGSSFDLRLGYQKTWLNRLGGELLLTGQIGSTTGFGIDLYQPLEPTQTFFAESLVSYTRTLSPIYQDNQKLAEYRVKAGAVDIAAGVNVGLLGQVRAGWQQKNVNYSLETGPLFFPTGDVSYGGYFAGLDFDQFDTLYFPTRGWSTNLRYFSTNDPDSDYSRLDTEFKGAYPFGRYVLSGEAYYGGSPRGTLPIYDAVQLGGFLRMSAFAQGQLIGDDVYYAQLRAERIIGVMPIGIRGDIRLGIALETAKRGLRYTETNLDGWLNSTTLYLGGETPLGPVYLGYAYSTSGTWNIYFFLGTP